MAQATLQDPRQAATSRSIPQSAVAITLEGDIPLYLIVHVVPRQVDWTIKGVEIYSHPDYRSSSLIGDDFFAGMPQSSKDAIVAALDTYAHNWRQRLQNLARLSGVAV